MKNNIKQLKNNTYLISLDNVKTIKFYKDKTIILSIPNNSYALDLEFYRKDGSSYKFNHELRYIILNNPLNRAIKDNAKRNDNYYIKDKKNYSWESDTFTLYINIEKENINIKETETTTKEVKEGYKNFYKNYVIENLLVYSSSFSNITCTESQFDNYNFIKKYSWNNISLINDKINYLKDLKSRFNKDADNSFYINYLKDELTKNKKYLITHYHFNKHNKIYYKIYDHQEIDPAAKKIDDNLDFIKTLTINELKKLFKNLNIDLAKINLKEYLNQ